jgi:hypothetical protein
MTLESPPRPRWVRRPDPALVQMRLVAALNLSWATLIAVWVVEIAASWVTPLDGFPFVAEPLGAVAGWVVGAATGLGASSATATEGRQSSLLIVSIVCFALWLAALVVAIVAPDAQI